MPVKRPTASRPAASAPNEAVYTAEQLQPLLEALQAAKSGDFSARLPASRNGVLSEIHKSFNDVIGLNQAMADEVVRVARLVGREGRMTERARLKNPSGSWAMTNDSVNQLIEDLARPTTEVARVITAVADGDLTQKMALEIEGTPVKGEFLRIGTTVNTMVDQLSSFSAEVTRVAREVGTEGKLGGQAEVKGVSGTWKDLTDNVNLLAGNLTVQLRDVSKVATAIANGDLTQKITVDVKGEILQIKNVINQMVDSLSTFAGEVTRVAKEVGTEGILGGQAEVPNVAGTWKDLTDNVNFMASNLTTQVRGIAKVVTAVATGDLKQKLVVEAKGEVAALADTINDMTDTLSTFAQQVTTVAREVGTEGKLGGQAEVPNAAGTWKDLTDNVNFMAGNLTDQVRNIALVTTAVANGDLSQKITVDAKGEILELKDTINTMVDQLNTFAGEVTRVAREVGTEGKLGGQAEVKGVSGTWKDLTDNVNSLAGNLTDQVRNIALVTTAVANGDLSQKITVDVKGEILELKNTINTMVDQLNSFAGEVTRVAKEVGTEGILGGQAEVKGVSGTWKDLTDNVNSLASNLTDQVRNIALVTTAVANGDLSKTITVNAKGEILELKDTINTMVDQLNSFAAEVTRVAKEVGTEGKLGGQAEVKGVSGTWKDLTDNVNSLAGNLTDQVRNIALVTTAVANGDLSQKITVDVKGEILELKDTINTMVDQLNSFAAEVTRVAREVGTEGKLGGQAEVKGVSGTWKDLTDNVNFMASNLTTQVRGIVKVVTAVANGDLSQKFRAEAKGEVAALADTINDMTETLSIFAEQVTTVAREVGTEGILGGQAKVPNVAGTWKDLTDNVNFMASNLTTQVRGIAKVVTAVADGDLKQKLVVEAKGEVAALAETINSMTDTLSIFADQVTTVAGEVGTEGKLGGQAKVPNAAGTWKDLTDNVNFMANSLTTQVRAISDVATAVANGDLTRSITVEAQGEVDTLRNNINQMIGNLKETTQKNEEQDFLKTNLARFSRMMQGQKSLESVARLIMSEVTPLVNGQHGVFYINDSPLGDTSLKLISSYAYQQRKSVANRIQPGEGLVGQCALEKKSILLTNVPGDYIQISSGLGEAPPMNIIVLPVLFEGEIMAVIELASFQPFSEIHRTFLDQMTESIGVVLNMIQANVRTEELLVQSQSLTQELQSQSQELQSRQDELKNTNVELEAQARELEEKASLLEIQNTRVEQKNREVELARGALEEKAEQLAVSSKYKSEFLANMSHELRTPLNSMLILAKLLSDNGEHNLTDKQIEFAQTIHSSGGDLLNLINEILDLSKVEAGKMEVEIGDVPLYDVREYVERTFSQVAVQKGLDFRVEIAPDVPATIQTDPTRLQQVLKNLLSNAFKFTDNGQVTLEISLADRHEASLVYKGIRAAGTDRRSVDTIISFSVRDTGIGIARDKQRLIFEAFQQADGTTSRRYGGTGLGLSISREITRLLGGRIQVESQPDHGSTFTLFLPQEYTGETGPLVASTVEFDRTSKFDGISMRDGASGTNGGARNGVTTNGSAIDGMSQYATSNAASMSESSDTATEISVARSALHASLNPTDDDRNLIREGDRILLIVEDDISFARILLDTARRQGFKGIVALQGDQALAMAREYQPDAITLDLQLPVIDGWGVLDQLKRDPATRHIPVQVVSVLDRDRRAMLGAISYLEKPVSREAIEGALAHMKSFVERDVRELLIVEDDDVQRQSLNELLAGMDVNVTGVASGEEALAKLKEAPFDCVVLDLGLPDMAGFDVLKKIKRQAKYRDLPVVIYTGRDLSKQEEAQLKKYAATIITKDAGASERLLDETALFLHRVLKKDVFDSSIEAKSQETAGVKTALTKVAPAKVAAAKTKSIAPSPRPKSPATDTAKGDLSGRKVLIIDDDMRNIFALTSALENSNMNVIYAENGKEGIELLQNTPDIDLILMDVMMPGMDGYETTRAIRELGTHDDLPIISLTAKAMAGDREKSLESGANDYITKPVEIDALLDMIRKWSNVG
ncbi:MAG TPA: HAMP domain-containing protein [Abditibacteriaceae bacterium]|jgi:HAMP domain-containing protein/signal transduction histidine kinase/CheY-like chemotaxis protein